MRLFSKKKNSACTPERDDFDGYICSAEDPLLPEHQAITALLLENWSVPAGSADFWRASAKALPTGQYILAENADVRSHFVHAVVLRLQLLDHEQQLVRGKYSTHSQAQLDPGWRKIWTNRQLLFDLLENLLRAKLPLTRATLLLLLSWSLSGESYSDAWYPVRPLVEAAEQLVKLDGRTPELTALAEKLRLCLGTLYSQDHATRKLISRVEQIVANKPEIPLADGETWSDSAKQDINEVSQGQWMSWVTLLTECRDAAGATPSAKWITSVRTLITQIGEPQLSETLVRWFPMTAGPRTLPALSHVEWQERCMEEELSRNHQLVYRGLRNGMQWWEHRTTLLNAAKASGDVWTWLRSFTSQPEVVDAYVSEPPAIPVPSEPPAYDAIEEKLLLEPHMDILRGLAWVAGLLPSPEMARALTALALSAYRKVPGKGPRAVRVGNACITALSMIGGLDAVGQLAVLKVKVKFGTAQKQIEKALTVCATKSGVPRAELEEMGVPAYGLTEVGRGMEVFGDHTAELLVRGLHEVALVWRGPDGKEKKSLPAAVKAAHKDELKELAAAKKDIERMLPAQAERLDSLFLAQK